MSSTNLSQTKIVKSLKQLKRNFVTSQKILAQHFTPGTIVEQINRNGIDANGKNASWKHGKDKNISEKLTGYNAKYPVNLKLKLKNDDVSLIKNAQSQDINPTKLKYKYAQYRNTLVGTPPLLKSIVQNLHKSNGGGFGNYSTGSPPSNPNPGRHNYHTDMEEAINKQIVAEFNAGYAYLSMACFFGRNEIGMVGTYNFFMKMYEEENQHALALIQYQNMRGGHVKLSPVSTVECSDWCSIHKALEVSLEMEKLVSDKLIEVIKIAQKNSDIDTEIFITSEFMPEQAKSIGQLSQLLSRANKAGTQGISEYLFDREMGIACGHGCDKKLI